MLANINFAANCSNLSKNLFLYVIYFLQNSFLLLQGIKCRLLRIKPFVMASKRGSNQFVTILETKKRVVLSYEPFHIMDLKG